MTNIDHKRLSKRCPPKGQPLKKYFGLREKGKRREKLLMFTFDNFANQNARVSFKVTMGKLEWLPFQTAMVA